MGENHLKENFGFLYNYCLFTNKNQKIIKYKLISLTHNYKSFLP